MSTSPNMTLVIPDVGVTVDPTWANEIVTALNRLDLHDHTSSLGVRIPTSGLNINSDLSFGGYNATNFRTVRFSDQTAAPSTSTDKGIVYTLSGDLYYKNSAGTAVQITTGGSIAGVTGSISGLTSPASAAYSVANKTFTWLYNSSRHAKMSNGDIELHPYDGTNSYSFFNRIKASTSLASSIDITLPTSLPSDTVPLAMSSGGILAPVGSGSAATPAYNFSTETDCGLYISDTNEVSVAVGGSQLCRFQSLGIILGSGQFLAPSGSFSVPSYSFAADRNSGLYLNSAGNVDIVAANTRVAEFTSSYVAFPAGSATVPGIVFLGETNSGFYTPDDGEVGIVLNAVAQVRFAGEQILAGGVGGGSSSLPAYALKGDTNTGLYGVSADIIGVSAGGTLRFQASTTAVSSFLPVLNIAGTAAAPSYSFTGDPNTGVYNVSADVLGLATGGTLRLSMDSAGVYPATPILSAFSGSVGSPNYAFNGDPDTGMYSGSLHNVQFATDGVLNVTLSPTEATFTTPIQNLLGSASAPAYSFASDTNTGIYSSGADTLNITTGGTSRVQITTQTVQSTLPVLGPSGGASTPTFAFTSSPSTGMYLSAADTLNFTTAGVSRIAISSTGRLGVGTGSVGSPAINFSAEPTTGFYFPAPAVVGLAITGSQAHFFSANQHAGPFGSSGAPSFSFASDNATGIYRSSSSTLGFSSNGSSVGSWSSSALTVTSPTTLSGATTISNTVTMTGSGGSAVAHKTTIVTGTISGSTSNLSVFSGATVYSVSGWVERAGGSFTTPIENTTGTSTSSGVAISGISDGTTVLLDNTNGSSRVYRLVIIHA